MMTKVNPQSQVGPCLCGPAYNPKPNSAHDERTASLVNRAMYSYGTALARGCGFRSSISPQILPPKSRSVSLSLSRHFPISLSLLHLAADGRRRGGRRLRHPAAAGAGARWQGVPGGRRAGGVPVQAVRDAARLHGPRHRHAGPRAAAGPLPRAPRVAHRHRQVALPPLLRARLAAPLAAAAPDPFLHGGGFVPDDTQKQATPGTSPRASPLLSARVAFAAVLGAADLQPFLLISLCPFLMFRRPGEGDQEEECSDHLLCDVRFSSLFAQTDETSSIDSELLVGYLSEGGRTRR